MVVLVIERAHARLSRMLEPKKDEGTKGTLDLRSGAGRFCAAKPSGKG
jgi:hypothetical protein